MLPSAVGGGLVASPVSALGKKATKASLAAHSLRFLSGGQGDGSAGSGDLSTLDPAHTCTDTLACASPALTTPATSPALGSQPCAVGEAEAEAEGEGEGENVAEGNSLPAPREETRNVCVIAHVDHGKTTLADCLLAAAGQLSHLRAGTACALDVGLEAERGITIHASAVSLGYAPAGRRACALRLNLVDCPGHAEFGSEVSAALRLCDGAFLLVDVAEGMRASSEATLQQALAQSVPIVLVLNKLDRALPAAWPTGADGAHPPAVGAEAAGAEAPLLALHAKMLGVIEQVNARLRAHGAREVSLQQGTVLFGSGFHGWLASLHDVAQLHAQRAGRALLPDAAAAERAREEVAAKVMRRLAAGSDESRARAFVQIALAPIAQLHALAAGGDARAVDAKLRTVLGRGLPPHELQPPADGRAAGGQGGGARERAKALQRAALGGVLLPAAQALLDAAHRHLPAPADAQRVRAVHLCSQPPRAAPREAEAEAEAEGEEAGGAREAAALASLAAAVRACDPHGELVACVAKMVALGPAGGGKGHAALCRVLSGCVRAGQQVWCTDEEGARDGARGAARCARVSRVVRFDGRGLPQAVSCARAGDVAALLGLDGALLRAGTVAGSAETAALAPLEFDVSIVERVAVSLPEGGVGARKLAECLGALHRSDPLLACGLDPETGERVLGGAGVLHLEVAVHRLRELLGPALGPRLAVAPPTVAHREGVRGRSAQPRLGKSANRLNRFWLVASPLSEQLVEALADGRTVPLARADASARARVLVERFGWERKDASRLLALGPEGAAANALVDCTVGVHGIELVRELLVDAFEEACAAGPLAGQRLRGVRFDLVDALIHPVAASRRPAQVVPAACRAMAAALLCASPVLIEPTNEISLSAPLCALAPIYDELGARRRALRVSHAQAEADTGAAAAASALCEVSAQLPTSELPGLADTLRAKLHGAARGLTIGRASWAPMAADEAAPAVAKLRALRGLPAAVPTADALADKL